MDEKARLEKLIDKNGYNLVFNSYVLDKLSIDEMEKLFEEHHRRKELMESLRG